VDKLTGYKTQSILCLPIFGPTVNEAGEHELLGVASLINKKEIKENTVSIVEFLESDKEIFQNLLTLVGIAIKSSNMYEDAKEAEFDASTLAMENVELYQAAKTEMKRGELLLKLAKTLYMEQDLKRITSTIIQSTREVMLADKASLFIIDEETQEVLLSALF
jgi:GAF domain-containing protein